jgi:heme/copper-type cytochrome/quinol oxidase subunit 2
MILKKILPFYETYGIRLLLTFWFLFTLACGIITVLAKGENATVASISLVSIFGWLVIILFFLFNNIFKHKNDSQEIILSPKNRWRVLRLLDILYISIYIILLIILQIFDDRPLTYYNISGHSDKISSNRTYAVFFSKKIRRLAVPYSTLSFSYRLPSSLYSSFAQRMKCSS